MRELYEELSRFAETEVNVPMSSMTTLRIGGYCDYVVYPDSVIALDGIIKLLDRYGVPYKMFGKGSDLLCSDETFHGAVIKLDRHFNKSYFTGNSILALAGCSIIKLSVDAMKNGLSGLEFASGIPGTIGGAVFMNAGAYKSSMSAIVEEVFVYRNGVFEWIPAVECQFAYRHTAFHDHLDWIIIAVRMKMKKKDAGEINELMSNRRKRRLASQPLEYPSCGSVFQNPIGYNAWELVEGIGYRGKAVGDACVSDKHCNFIINKGHATAEDYMKLVNEIQAKVQEKYGILLHTEMEKFNWQ